jgi:hypothetical protein
MIMNRTGEADFCLLFGGLQKVRRLTGRDPPFLPWNLFRMKTKPQLRRSRNPPKRSATCHIISRFARTDGFISPPTVQ